MVNNVLEEKRMADFRPAIFSHGLMTNENNSEMKCCFIARVLYLKRKILKISVKI